MIDPDNVDRKAALSFAEEVLDDARKGEPLSWLYEGPVTPIVNLAAAFVAVEKERDELRAALERSQTALYDAMHAGHLSREYHDSVIAVVERALAKEQPDE